VPITVKPHTEWHGTLPVYPMVDPSVRISGPLHKVAMEFKWISINIPPNGTLKNFGW